MDGNRIRFRWSAGYFMVALLLFITELLIALYVHDNFVRPYVGDFLVVIFIYAFIRTFWALPPGPLLIGVFLFACAIETAQYLDLVKRIGLENSPAARTVLGTFFSWNDIAAYALGCLSVTGVEWAIRNRPKPAIS
ncbi:DUF2809 domain-containing protein [Pedobacter yulinensis]|uniref:DUF2809 domain-containing protein n=2 Tax=Pedobacter yulinensis TaxID=2126353 RepID=A0A2T3HQ94_9SPHI|nr:DUF2809 domain-containing protein [Pedobacter yulinensis]